MDERCRSYQVLAWSPHKNIKESKRIIKGWIKNYTKKDFYLWAIVLKNGTDQPIGSISVVKQDEKLAKLTIGYCIGSKWWHQGIMSEALSGIIPFLFETVKANRIEAIHDICNPNSGKVMLKCGLTYEGTLRQCEKNNQGIVDARIYSILASEYYLRKKQS